MGRRRMSRRRGWGHGARGGGRLETGALARRRRMAVGERAPPDCGAAPTKAHKVHQGGGLPEAQNRGGQRGGRGRGPPPNHSLERPPPQPPPTAFFHSADQTQANGAAHTSERCRVRARAAAAKGAASRTSERCWVLAIVQQDTSRARGRSIINTRGRSYQIGGGGGGGGRRWRRRRKGGGDWGGREEEDLERARARG